ncbi:hypothetical protein PVAP13_8NG326284 [Panicum virgatum]|uniref:Uncharacterized protein n=1 Tax=Panicum virgatum TaxID=38727 RepID=A0A8T0PIQ4_PANVG|nr:hypothetical protein PVAP13_8NG326284 [Panicum virgatum]
MASRQVVSFIRSTSHPRAGPPTGARVATSRCSRPGNLFNLAAIYISSAAARAAPSPCRQQPESPGCALMALCSKEKIRGGGLHEHLSW